MSARFDLIFLSRKVAVFKFTSMEFGRFYFTFMESGTFHEISTKEATKLPTKGNAHV